MFAIRLLQKAKNQHHNNNQVYFQTSIRIQPRPMMQRKHCCIIVYLAALRNNRGDHNVEGLLISPKQLRCKNLEVWDLELFKVGVQYNCFPCDNKFWMSPLTQVYQL
ncbi:uncharacterized protein LOC113308397 isoform X2 [Papaver somniferum]|uniref:uncharacterized protein LOC113308397 isoform X2 n=1 Tax=Papaver somniferum TaxID=3469 RepID=UPI000E6FBE3A|nr:uncharacterized protein LOC113308397 isoform X2 [Papaver somniferum]XP_026412648.1 uncharacterized protein LOC113308397 isoform X2 [Papaver somniferum]